MQIVIGVLVTCTQLYINNQPNKTKYNVQGEQYIMHDGAIQPGLYSLLCGGWPLCPTSGREWAVGSRGAAGWLGGGLLLATVGRWVWAYSALFTYVSMAAESVATLVAPLPC